MPYAKNQGIHIHYQVEGEGPPLVLQHGSAQSVENWRQYGYVSALKPSYQLILIDARGHGASDKPRTAAAYRMPLKVSDITAVLDDLNLSQTHFLGYSMGGRMGFGLATYAPERVCSLIIGGAHPYKRAPEPFEKRIEGLRRGQKAEATPRSSYDAEALIALYRENLDEVGLEAVLPTITTPCLFYAGEDDPYYSGVRDCIEHIRNVTFVSLPGLNHIQAMERSDLVLPHLSMFLNELMPT